MLDAPLSGSPVSLEQDKAGDRRRCAAFEKVLPVLRRSGPLSPTSAKVAWPSR